jgi:predicted RecB family nuclease
MTRYDVSAVPLQGSYVAKRCPVRAQNEVVVPVEFVPMPPVIERRILQGREFEASVVEDFMDLHGDSSMATALSNEDLESVTANAIAEQVLLILGGHLPPDVAGRRVGRPDVLVISRQGGYRAVDIKHHMALEPRTGEHAVPPARCSTFDHPCLEDAASEDQLSARKNQNDLLQLAHYQRILEAAGVAATDGRFGGIVGVEGRIVWHDLDFPMWRPAVSDNSRLISTMESYDIEFEFRLDVLATAYSHLDNPAIELLVHPVRIGECGECPWWGYCGPQIESGFGDISLLPRVGVRERQIHHDHGVFDRRQLAALDIRTARLVAAGVDVAGILPLIEGLPEETPIGALDAVVRSKAQIARMEAEGVASFGDLLGLCPLTASYSGAWLSSLPDRIDSARAALGSDAIYRRRGVAALKVPRADVEVDIDMENVEAGVYLWGALVTLRTGSDATSEYHSFVTWDRLTPDVESDNSLKFWRWFTALRDATHSSGRSFLAYCYNSSAENTYLRRLGMSAGITEEITTFIDSDQWVDMLRVVDQQLITGVGSGLKLIAPLADFSWGVEDAGGGESMVRYDMAAGSRDDGERDSARLWLLTYNQGDVEATLALREWMTGRGDEISSIESVNLIEGVAS